MNPPLNPMLVVDVPGLEKVADFFSRVTEFVVDSETNITESFFDRRIRTIQVGNRQEQYVIDLLAFAGSREALIACQGNNGAGAELLLGPVIRVLKPVLDSNKWLKLGTTLQFDYEMFKWNLGIRMWHLYDCNLAEKVIYAGVVDYRKAGFYALDDMVERYCALLISKHEQRTFDLETPLTEAQFLYAALDCRFPVAIQAGQAAYLASGKLERIAQIEFDAVPAFGDMRLNGLLIDEQTWLKLAEQWEEKLKLIIAKMDESFIPAVGPKGIPKFDLDALELVWKNTEPNVVGSAKRMAARKEFEAARKAVNDARNSMEDYAGEAAINYGSHQQLRDALLKMGFKAKQLPSTNDKVLEKIAKHPTWDAAKVFKDDLLAEGDIIDLIRLHREVSKLLTTYGVGFLTRYVNLHTGRVHSSINQMGAETGRSSSSKPNVQNLPRDERYRSCFVARPGNKMLTLDYSGCELRILAELSKERVWLDAFLKNWDVHSVGAEILFGQRWTSVAEPDCAYATSHQKCTCKEHKKLREQVKAINFGLAYGMGPRKLSETLGIPYDDAMKLMNAYKHAFPTVTKYLEESGVRAKISLEARTILGRRRRWKKPEWAEAMRRACEDLGRPPTNDETKQKYVGMFGAIEREGKNSPIQGTNADMAKLAMGCGFSPDGKPYAWHILEPKFRALQENFVHDEIVVEASEGVADDAFHALGDCMQRAGAEMVKLVPMTYEGSIADCWKK